jgi:hypothetical protein
MLFIYIRDLCIFQHLKLRCFNMSKIVKYWSGNKRLISDILWSVVITIFLNVIRGGYQILPPEDQLEYVARFLGGVVGIFFLFFFWSWNRHHIKCRIAKFAVHTCFGFLVLGLVVVLISGVLFQMGWVPLLFTLAYNGLVVRKYFKLMWAKKERKRDLEPDFTQ